MRLRRQEGQTSKHKHVRAGPTSFTLNTTDGKNPQIFYVSNPAPPAPEAPIYDHTRQQKRPPTRGKPVANIETPAHTLQTSTSHRRIVSAPAAMVMSSLGLGTDAAETDDDPQASIVPFESNNVKAVQKVGSEKSDKSEKFRSKTSVRSASTGGGYGSRGSRSTWEGAVEMKRSKSPSTSAVAKKSTGIRWPWLLT